MANPKAVIIDVDGTIALHTTEERGHFEYSKVINDLPNMPIIRVIRAILLGSDYYPLFVSGRADENNGQVREDTIWFIDHHVFSGQPNFPFTLFMRPEWLPGTNKRDFRPDYQVKKQLYLEEIRPYYDIVVAIDDRPQVLRMWHSVGIPIMAVGTPWIDF